jgi:hypothetical protein
MMTSMANGRSENIFSDEQANDSDQEEEIPMENMNYLHPVAQAIGLSIASLCFVSSLALGLWVYRNREVPMIKVSQPQFMYLICLGSAMAALGVFPLSFDESHGFSERTLSLCCMSYPWFCQLGYIILYLALFSKVRTTIDR